MQSACIGSLMELAEKDKNVLYLTADSGEGGLDLMFRRNFPDRAFDFGIAEANMVAAASGMAASGKIPFIYTAAPFLVYRSYEFIRNDICLQNLPVKLIGTGSGVTVSSLGATHHTTEDVSLLRSLPGLIILSPATPKQAFECVKYAYGCDRPVYIRIAMNKEKEYLQDDYQFLGQSIDVLKNGNQVALLTTGSILQEVMDAADILERDGILGKVINIPLLKPFGVVDVVKQIEEISYICTVEEHNVIGGLGSMVAELLVDATMTRKLLKIGLNDCFSAGYGTLSQLRRENGLDALTIAERIKGFLNE